MDVLCNTYRERYIVKVMREMCYERRVMWQVTTDRWDVVTRRWASSLGCALEAAVSSSVPSSLCWGTGNTTGASWDSTVDKCLVFNCKGEV